MYTALQVYPSYKHTDTQVYIMYTAVQEYPSYKHADTGLYHAPSCPGISLLQTHRHRSISCTQLSRNTPPTNTQTQVYIMHPAVQEYPSYKHTDTQVHIMHPAVQEYPSYKHTDTQVHIMHPAVQEYPSYKHTDTGLYHAPSCPGIPLLQTHRHTGPYHAPSCPGISLLQTHRHRSISCTQLSRNTPPTNTQTHRSISCTQLSRNIPPTKTQVYIMHTAVQEYPSYKHADPGLYHVPSCPGISLLRTRRHRSISCTQLSRNIPPTNTQTQVYIMHTAVQEYPSYKHTDTQVYIMHPAVQEYPSYKHTDTGLYHAPSCPGIPLLQTHRHRSISCTQLSRNIPPKNTNNCTTRIHSSRMRTARSLTVSRSIRSGAVCQHPPGCRLPPSPDADHPPW